jgi:hypothetical protein
MPNRCAARSTMAAPQNSRALPQQAVATSECWWDRSHVRPAAVWLLFVTGVAILYLRNYHSLVYPVLYAEDGTWIASVLRDGFVHAVRHARDDPRYPEYYLVGGNVLLLWVSAAFSRVMAGYDLAVLPQAVSVVSMCAFSAVITTASVAAKSWPLFLRLWLWLLLLLSPYGHSSNEILGRIANIGFLAPVFAAALLLIRQRTAALPRVLLIDLALLLAVFTSPICAILVPAALALRYLYERYRGGKWSASASWISAAFVVIVSGAYSLWLALLRAQSAAPKEAWNPSTVIEFLFARVTLYPFLFPFYTWLTDVAALIGTAMLGGVIVWAMRKRVAGRWPLLQLLLIFALVTAGTLFGRPGLTNWLDAYTTTFPDRYFFSVSWLFLMCMAEALALLWRSGDRARIFAAVFPAAVIAVYAIGASQLFEFGTPRMSLQPPGPWLQSIACAARANPAAVQSETGIVPVESAPVGMGAFGIPSAYIRGTIAAHLEAGARNCPGASGP